MNQGKSTPAPIFNARKRPRQAVITEPGYQLQTEHSFPDSSSFDLMPVHGFNKQNPHNNQADKSFRGNQQVPASRKFGNHNGGIKNTRGKSYVTSWNNNNNRQQQNTRGGLSRVSGSGLKQGKHCQPVRNWSPGQDQSGHLTTGHPQYGQEHQEHRSPLNRTFPSSFHSDESLDNKRSQTTGQSSEYGHRQEHRLGGACSGSPMGYQPNPLTRQFGDSRLPNKSTATPQTQRPSFPRGAMSTTSNTNINHTERNTAQRDFSKVTKPVASSSKQTTSKITDNNSLHMITTNTEGMIRWSKYKDYINLLFELYGIVDSAVITDQSGTAKQFALRDDCGHVQCTFYEIDRPLPQLTRGYLHRVVGSYDSRKNHLKCLSVRQCSPDEANLAYQNASSQQEHLIELTKRFREQ